MGNDDASGERTATPLGPLVYALAAISFVSLFLPIVVIAILSFSASPNMRFPPVRWGFSWYLSAFSREDFVNGLAFSAVIALIATVTMMACCLPLAYHRRRSDDAVPSLLATLALTPLLIPEVVLGLAALNFFVAARSSFPMLNIIILHSILMMPFIYKIFDAGFANLSPSTEEAARVLGASSAKAFLFIVLPELTNTLFVAFIFGFVTSFQNFTATLFLVKRDLTLPIAIFNYIRTESDPSVAAISTVITGVIFILVYAVDRIVDLRNVVK